MSNLYKTVGHFKTGDHDHSCFFFSHTRDVSQYSTFVLTEISQELKNPEDIHRIQS